VLHCFALRLSKLLTVFSALAREDAGAEEALASMKLGRAFYEQATVQVARQLLGTHLVQVHPDGLTAGMILETEACVGLDDKASHASRGGTPRTAMMFGSGVSKR
jgi:3-methyladenine DNA glycosylase Mpg